MLATHAHRVGVLSTSQGEALHAPLGAGISIRRVGLEVGGVLSGVGVKGVSGNLALHRILLGGL